MGREQRYGGIGPVSRQVQTTTVKPQEDIRGSVLQRYVKPFLMGRVIQPSNRDASGSLDFKLLGYEASVASSLVLGVLRFSSDGYHSVLLVPKFGPSVGMKILLNEHGGEGPIITNGFSVGIASLSWSGSNSPKGVFNINSVDFSIGKEAARNFRLIDGKYRERYLEYQERYREALRKKRLT